ncbi:MAG: YggS family pyridoxal phosphate-dependent enzyme [Bacteroidetes bacterium]|nr:YggS family pyridoxal phosphate-dependent enzyme [Bacteroidota bacterium]
MIRVLVLSTLMVLLFGCGNKEKTPKGILTSKEMQNILPDAIQVESRLQALAMPKDSVTKYAQIYYAQVCDKHKITPTKFFKSLKYYSHYPTQFSKMMQPVNSVHLIHSVDSLKLLEEIQKQAQKNNINVNYLLQIYIATEETKFGLSFKEAEEIISAYKNGNQPNIKICGLMGMASNTEDNQLIKKEFKSLKHFFDLMKEKYFPNDTSFATISMGMSSDYGLAIEEGSNMIRLGSAIFGSRY